MPDAVGYNVGNSLNVSEDDVNATKIGLLADGLENEERPRFAG